MEINSKNNKINKINKKIINNLIIYYLKKIKIIVCFLAIPSNFK